MDGKQVFYAASRGAHRDLFVKDADGSGEERPPFRSDQDKIPVSASPDGKYLLFVSRDPQTDNDLWLLPLGTSESKPTVSLNTSDPEANAQISPDQRWIAYTVTRSGAPEVTVRPFPAMQNPAPQNEGARWLIASAAINPRWSVDSKKLYCVTLNAELQFVEVDPDRAGNPARRSSRSRTCPRSAGVWLPPEVAYPWQDQGEPAGRRRRSRWY